MQNLNIYGCACRCLIELARLNGRVIKEEDLLSQFCAEYPSWFRRPGMTDTLKICEVAKALGIAEKATVTRQVEKLREFQNLYDSRLVNGILIFSELPSGHVTLLLKADQAEFTVWSPQQDGTIRIQTHIWNEWESLMMHGLILA